MEERRSIYNVDLTFQLLQSAVGVEDVGVDKPTLQRLLVFEELVAQLDELQLEVGAVALPAVDAVCDQASDVLGKSTAEVQVRLLASEHAWQDLRAVELVLAYGEVEETPLSDARVGSDGPRFITLRVLISVVREALGLGYSVLWRRDVE